MSFVSCVGEVKRSYFDKVKQASILDAVYQEHHRFPKQHWGKFPNICRSRMFSCPICCKRPIWRANLITLSLLMFYFSFYQFLCSNVNTINKSMILHNFHRNFFLRLHYLLYTYLSLIPASILFSIKFCQSLLILLMMFSKQMKVLQMNRTFLVLSLFHSWPSLGKMPKQCINIIINAY